VLFAKAAKRDAQRYALQRKKRLFGGSVYAYFGKAF
jgi:hypothetical protein